MSKIEFSYHQEDWKAWITVNGEAIGKPMPEQLAFAIAEFLNSCSQEIEKIVNPNGMSNKEAYPRGLSRPANTSLARMIHSSLVSKNVRTREVGEVIGYSGSTISGLKNGYQKASKRVVLALATYFNWDVTKEDILSMISEHNSYVKRNN